MNPYTPNQIAILKADAKEILNKAKLKVKKNSYGNIENITDRAVYYLFADHNYLYELYKDFLPTLNVKSATQKNYVDFVSMC